MTHENFNTLVDSLEEIRINTLKTKNAKYAPENDALHNFHVGAEIMGTTVPQCIWGYATKHIVSLRDKIMRDDWSDKDDALEKIQDIQNYLTFIWCAINEDRTIEVKGENTDFDYGIISIKPINMDKELPFTPITMMRNALGVSEGGSGIEIDRKKYMDGVEFWSKNVMIQ